jgi:tetratricopeptide (TPR) repeat protein
MSELAENPTRSLDAENPWPGLMAFTEATRDYFHGRDAEAAELLRRVRRERLTILFGQSGLGKTSLLSAGLFPRLRAADFLPVYRRLDFANPRLPPVAQIKQALAEELTRHDIEGPAPHCQGTLWAYFHGKETEFWSRRNRLVTPVLVLDQFEEIFTLGRGAASVDVVIDELAGLVENRPPSSVAAALERDPDAAQGYDFAKDSCKLIFALREDFLPDFEGLRRRMPSIMENRMRLTRMDGRQARDVILAKGGHLVAPGVAEKVIAFVAASRGHSGEEAVEEGELTRLEIEPALLSIVCSELNKKRIELVRQQITADLLEGAQQEIVAQFYTSSLAGIDPAVKLFIEEQLLTSEGYRYARPLPEALREPGVTRADIDKLVAGRLLRIEDRRGMQWVELTHDLLTDVIRQQRDLRREQTRATQDAEARAQAERERAERAEAEALRERAEREAQVKLAREAAERERVARQLVRRTRIALAFTVVALVVAVGAIFYAFNQQRFADARAQEAAEQSRRATQSYAAALTAAKNDVEAVDRYTKAGKIRTEVARSLLDAARTTFAGLPSAHEGAETTRVRIHLFSALAETYLAFGDLKSAREAAETERTLSEPLAQSSPEGLHDLADSHNKLGEVLKRQGDLANALQEYGKGLAAMKEAAAKSPANDQWLRDIAENHRKIADVLEDRSNLARALEEQQESVRILTQLTAKDPDNGTWRHDLAESHRDIGWALKARGDRANAAKELQSAIKIMAELTRKEQDNDAWQWMLAICQGDLGEVLEDQGQLSDARELFQNSLTILNQLVTKDPDNSQWRHDLAVIHNKIGSLRYDENDLDAALSEAKKTVEILADLVKRDPLNVFWQRELAPSYGWVGNVLLSQGASAEALAKFLTFLDMMTDLAEKDPNNADWAEQLAEAHARVGQAQAQQVPRDLATARKESDAALKIDGKLVLQDPENADWQLRLMRDHIGMGDVLRAQRDYSGALNEFQLALGVIGDLVSKDPDNALWRSSLSVSHTWVGVALEDQGNLADALKEFRAARAIIGPLVEKEPSNTLWKQYLSDADDSIDTVLQAQGNATETKHRRPGKHAVKSR